MFNIPYQEGMTENTIGQVYSQNSLFYAIGHYYWLLLQRKSIASL